MTNTELITIKDSIKRLAGFVIQYGNGRYNAALAIMNDIVIYIDSDNSNNDKTDYIVSKYKMLFPPSGGLSDFSIYDENYEKRIELNAPVEKAENDLWEILKPYCL